MRPIRAKKPLPQVGQKWVGAVLLVLAALSLRTARFSSATHAVIGQFRGPYFSVRPAKI